jgi:hypothetical protein
MSTMDTPSTETMRKPWGKSSWEESWMVKPSPLLRMLGEFGCFGGVAHLLNVPENPNWRKRMRDGSSMRGERGEEVRLMTAESKQRQL